MLLPVVTAAILAIPDAILIRPGDHHYPAAHIDASGRGHSHALDLTYEMGCGGRWAIDTRVWRCVGEAIWSLHQRGRTDGRIYSGVSGGHGAWVRVWRHPDGLHLVEGGWSGGNGIAPDYQAGMIAPRRNGAGIYADVRACVREMAVAVAREHGHDLADAVNTGQSREPR